MRFATMFCTAMLFLVSCKKDPTPVQPPPVTPPTTPSSNKNITSFVLKAVDNPTYLSTDVSGLIGTDTVTISLIQATQITHLVPTISISGDHITPSSGVAQDFTHPVTYTVTAQDSSTKNYIVVVTSPKVPSAVIYSAGGQSSTSDGHLYAINADDGSLIWSVKTGSGMFAVPTYSNGIVYMTDDSSLRAFNAANGIEVWKYQTPGYNQCTPIVWNSTVYFQGGNDILYALNAATGVLQWKYSMDTVIQGSVASISNPTIVNGVLYIGTRTSSILYAFDAASGKVLWNFKPPVTAGFETGPCVDNGLVFIGDDYNNLFAFNATNGTVKWSVPSDGLTSSVASANGILYYGSSDDGLYARKETTGELLWDFLTPHPIYTQNPIIADSVVYFASYDLLYAADAQSGRQKWMYQNDGDIPTGPTYYNGKLYFGSYASVRSVDATNGQLLWSFTAIGNQELMYGVCIVDSKGNIYHNSVAGDVN